MPTRITDLVAAPPAKRGVRITDLVTPKAPAKAGVRVTDLIPPEPLEEPPKSAKPEPTPPARSATPPVRGVRVDQVVRAARPSPEAVPAPSAPKAAPQVVGEGVESYAKGVLLWLPQLMESVGGLVQSFGDDLESSRSYWDVIGSVGPMGFAKQALLPGFPALQGLRELREANARAFQGSDADERIAGAGKAITDHARAFVSNHPELFQTPDGKLNDFLAGLGTGTPSIALSMGITAVTGQPALAAMAFGALQKGSLYNEATDAGVPQAEKSISSTTGGIGEAALEYLGLKIFFKKYAGPMKTRLIRVADNVAQEWSQQVSENAVAANWRKYPSFWNLFDNAGQAALIGGILGVPADVLLTAADRAGFVKELEQVGIPREQGKQLVAMVMERDTEEVAKQAPLILAEETGQKTAVAEEAPVPGDPVVRPVADPTTAPTLEFTPNPNLTEEEKPQEAAAYEWLAENPQARVQEYLERFPKTVNPDNSKEMIPGYNGLNANALHEVSSAHSKLVFTHLLDTKQGQGNNTVLVTAGGSGAGKTGAIRDSIPTAEYPIILDTNLSNVKTAVKKIDQAKQAGFQVDIVYVHRDPITSFMQGVVPRAMSKNRVVAIEDHVKRHLESPATILRLAEHYQGDPDVTIRVLDNNYGKGQAKGGELDLLRQGGYTQTGLEGALNEALTDLERTGEVPAAYAARLRGRLEPPSAARRAGERASDPAGSPGTGNAGGAGSAQAPPVPPVVSPPTSPDPTPEHRGLTPTATLLKARLTKLSADIKGVDQLMRQVEQQRAQLAQRGIGARGLDARLMMLSKRYDYLDSSIAELLTSAPEDIREQLLASPGTLELNELLKAEDRAARAMKHQTLLEQRLVQAQKKAELIEAFKTRQETLDQRRARVDAYVKARLPLAARGKFLTMVRQSPTDASLAKMLHRIDAEADRVIRKQLIGEIKSSLKDALDSPSVAVDYKARLGGLVRLIELSGHRPETLAEIAATRDWLQEQRAAGKDVELPQAVLDKLDILNRRAVADVPTRHLYSVLEQVQLLTRLGKTKLDARKTLYAAEKDAILRQLIAGSTPLELRALHATKPGEKLSPQEVLENIFRNHLNALQQVDLAVTPMNAVFDLLDGLKGYYGANSRNFKHRLDADFWRFLDYKDELLDPILALNSKLGLTAQNYERIGVHAYRMQPGGLRYLQNLGLAQADIDAIRLTPNEQQLYDKMREIIEQPFPTVQRLTEELYNRPINKVANYFPVQTDWDAMSVQEIVDLTENPEFRRLQKNVEQGFTLQRKGGRQKVKLNALDIFHKHITDVAYFVTMARNIKLLSDVAVHPDYQAAAGQYGQHLVRRWLDIMARMGGVDGDKRIAAIDSLRRNFGAGVLGFKLSSILVQPTALLDGAAQIGGRYVFQGFNRVVTDPDWRKFLSQHVPELRERGADDPAFLELSENPTLARWQAMGYGPLQQADLLTASAVVAGAYQRALDARGLALDLTSPNQEALQEAVTMLQRTQASPYFKDTPLAVSGVGLTGNKSVNKILLQFRSFMLTRWAQIRHDAWRAGFRQGDFRTGTRVMAWLAAANVAEAGIRAVASKPVQAAVLLALAGTKDWDEVEKVLDKEFEDIPEDVFYEILGSVPFLDNIIARTYQRGQAIPALSFIDALRDGVTKMTTGKTPQHQLIGAIRLLEGVAQAYGVPGASQASQTATGVFKPPPARRGAKRAQ